MRKPEKILHKGKEITFLDYSNLKTKDEITQLLKDGSAYIRSKPKGSVLSLVNVENMFFNNDIRVMMTENVKYNSPHIKKSAVFGLTGLITIMFKSFLMISGRNMKAFNTKEAAMDYLVSD
ncbi:MAG: hypothetical protein K9H26_10335 [Prolixibacteraceae bacterium]|nr:hypothetical protein [Prolixibacteraceae bacterium]